MSAKVLILCFIFLLGFLFSFSFSSGTFAKDMEEQSQRLLSSHPAAFHLQISKFDELLTEKPSPHRMLILPVSAGPDTILPQLDVTTSVTTVPTTTPTYSNPTPMGTPVTTPTAGTPTTTTPSPPSNASSGGQSWCIASQSASQSALKAALDYACGYGGADCTAIQQGGSCFNPDTLRDHASYAFNSYYQKNPVPTSCDFGGAAIITNTDPSTSTCRYPSSASSNSTSSSTTNTTSPTGSSPPGYGGSGGMSSSFSLIMILLLSLVCLIQGV